ncbi:probable disease resistance protein At4g27220 [Gossypium hirsutum]|uniref:Probable disease resistance protein At4g27220 n=1 Tax=Gossypium hirsutum TaxID=3635 RepID=A0A1U8N1I3_GOSHI|nr:probable disease resistance protein At4g27220 [Gossypium hirsutum]
MEECFTRTGELSSSNFTGITAAYSAIEWSFNYLESEEVKLTFLLCSVIGHNGRVKDLVRYTLGLGLFNAVNTMKEARNKVLTVVANLKASALLLDSDNDWRFDIHDVVRDAALAIALKDYRMLVLRDHVPNELYDKEKMKGWSVISLACPQIIAELPKEMECLGLSFFHMAYDGAVKIPPNFFKQTEGLRVLDFLGMQFPFIPESISQLTDLRMLCLKKCAVDDLSILRELKSLEVLDLSHSGIKELPKEMAQLSQLSFVEWEKEGVVENERKNACLDELNNLSCLTTLSAHIPDVQMIPKHQFVETLDRFRVFVGDYNSKSGVAPMLKIEGCEGLRDIILAEEIEEKRKDVICFHRLDTLHIKGLPNLIFFNSGNHNIDFPLLKELTIERCPKLRAFISQSSNQSDMHSLFSEKSILHPGLIPFVMKLALDTSSPTLAHLNKMV